MKQIALLKYQIMFDPSITWSNGYQFENQLAQFFAAYGFEAQIIAAAGGSGERVIWLERIETPQSMARKLDANQSKTIPASNQIKQVQSKVPPKDFKQFKQPKHNMIQPPKMQYQMPGQTNRGKVRMP